MQNLGTQNIGKGAWLPIVLAVFFGVALAGPVFAAPNPKSKPVVLSSQESKALQNQRIGIDSVLSAMNRANQELAAQVTKKPFVNSSVKAAIAVEIQDVEVDVNNFLEKSSGLASPEEAR
ncbi:MAG: hypothetical protein V1821_02535, partial [bacterium]